MRHHQTRERRSVDQVVEASYPHCEGKEVLSKSRIVTAESPVSSAPQPSNAF